MTIYAVDPGTEQSALVVLKGARVVDAAMFTNTDLVRELGCEFSAPEAVLVIEEVESFGMPVGREVFQTVFWAGRFAEAWSPRPFVLLPRRTVKLTLCGTSRAKDPHIRQRLIDLYGGPACARKGGALAGIKSHLWSALALAVAYQQTQKAEEPHELLV